MPWPLTFCEHWTHSHTNINRKINLHKFSKIKMQRSQFFTQWYHKFLVTTIFYTIVPCSRRSLRCRVLRESNGSDMMVGEEDRAHNFWQWRWAFLWWCRIHHRWLHRRHLRCRRRVWRDHGCTLLLHNHIPSLFFLFCPTNFYLLLNFFSL